MIVLDGIRIALSAFPLDLFGFEKHTSLTGSGRSSLSFSTRLRVLKLALVEGCQLPWAGLLPNNWTSMGSTSRGVQPARRDYD
jgi:hypothetical protein